MLRLYMYGSKDVKNCQKHIEDALKYYFKDQYIDEISSFDQVGINDAIIKYAKKNSINYVDVIDTTASPDELLVIWNGKEDDIYHRLGYLKFFEIGFKLWRTDYNCMDYNTFTYIDTPMKERRELNVGDIYKNAAVCSKCDDYIRSKNRHDYVTCKCGNVSVDGGSWYVKRSCQTLNFKNDIVYYNEVPNDVTN